MTSSHTQANLHQFCVFLRLSLSLSLSEFIAQLCVHVRSGGLRKDFLEVTGSQLSRVSIWCVITFRKSNSGLLLNIYARHIYTWESQFKNKISSNVVNHLRKKKATDKWTNTKHPYLSLFQFEQLYGSMSKFQEEEL